MRKESTTHEKAALKAANAMTYEPAEVGGEPVKTNMVLEYKFA